MGSRIGLGLRVWFRLRFFFFFVLFAGLGLAGRPRLANSPTVSGPLLAPEDIRQKLLGLGRGPNQLLASGPLIHKPMADARKGKCNDKSEPTITTKIIIGGRGGCTIKAHESRVLVAQ